MTAAVEFHNVSRHFGPVRAVDGVDLTIAEGSFFAMLGPSGSGKTTCLRLISGFEKPTGGTIRIFGEDVGAIAAQPAQREHGLSGLRAVPAHERARQRGLRADGQGRGPRRRGRARPTRCWRWSSWTATATASRAQLSGGQRQRVALARALVNEPRVLLLDEPLGALDLKLREAMQDELKALQKRLGITFVFVTHDQGEALSMADQVAVFSDGKIAQVGTPEEVYGRPRTRFVADFVGSSNVLPPELTSRSRRPCTLVEPATRGAAADGGDRCADFGHRRYFALPRLGHAGGRRGTRGRAWRARSHGADPAGTGCDRGADLRAGCASCDGRGVMPGPVTLPARGPGDRLTGLFWRRPNVLLLLLLAPPLLWLGVVYLGSLAALLAAELLFDRRILAA